MPDGTILAGQKKFALARAAQKVIFQSFLGLLVADSQGPREAKELHRLSNGLNLK
jgi:hypothetical protein